VNQMHLPLALTFLFLSANAAANESITLPPPLDTLAGGSPEPAGPVSADPGTIAALLSLTSLGSTFFSDPIPPAF
jgi:hypothetical protein